MFSAGEVSGDVHGASLAREIRKLSPETELIGFGGDLMASAGVRLFKNFKDYNIMGVLEVVKNIQKIFRLLNELTEFVRTEKPDMLVLIDYPDFNWRLAKRVKELGVKVFSYIPPSAWAWRKGRAVDCAKIADEFVAIFPFETKVYEEAGANISFLGNPLVDTVKPSMTQEQARTHFNFNIEDHVILLMPGSRKQEINMLLQPMLDAAKILSVDQPKTKFFLPLAAGVDKVKIHSAIQSSGVEITTISENRYDLMSIADAAMATSGTVVLEAALLNLPCVVLYKMAKLNYCIARLFVHIDYFCLPNILLNKNILPELLQDGVKPTIIADEVSRLYRGQAHREEVVIELQEACSKLDQPGAAKRIAQKILTAAEKL